MQGQSECLSENNTVKNAYEYKYLTDEIVELKNPVGENITYDFKKGYVFDKNISQKDWVETHITGSSCYNNTNLVPEFCRAYTTISGKEVLAVHIAKGSTEIAYWLPGSAGYEILVKKSNAAQKKVKAEQVFFVWLQGESDAICGHSKDYYKQKIQKLCDTLKQDIGINKFAIIRVGRFTKDNRDLEIIAAQDEICFESNDFLMLTDIATELNEQSDEYMNPFVKGHYSAKGLEKLGSTAGAALADYVKKHSKD